jgi:hypothetical protein
MVHLQKHAEEMFWLQRRIKFLQTLDCLLENDASAEDADHIASQYSKVENPKDLVDRLKDIYGKDLE